MNSFCVDNINGQIRENESLSKHTTYKIGGSAKYFALVNDIESLISVLKCAKNNNIDWFIIGGGSNLLVSDEGFDGLVIKLDGQFSSINFNDDKSICICGSSTSTLKIVNTFLENKLSGFEFLCGIPGSIGGAVKMNAGRKDEFVSSLIEYVEILDEDLSVKTYDKNDITWGYRSSSINNEQIIINVGFKCVYCQNDDETEKSNLLIKNYLKKRKQSQPLDLPSCGSVFRNPENNSAGKLIEDVGLKGHCIGGAKISEKHANFIVNCNNASADDVVKLINVAQKKVKEKFDIELIPEVKFLGFNYECSLF